MSNTQNFTGLQGGTLKPWSECHESTKVERLREEVKILRSQNARLFELLNELSEKIQLFNTHDHCNGRVVVDVVDVEHPLTAQYACLSTLALQGCQPFDPLA